MNTTETLVFDGREVHLKWCASSTFPSDITVSQVVGFCFDAKGNILLVKNKRGWGFPGGHPEVGETVLMTLDRELMEEANVTVKDPVFIGYMEVKDPLNDSVEGQHYIQLRYIAEIRNMSDFTKEFETSERMLVPAEKLPEYIEWLASPTGSSQHQALLRNLPPR